ncbi:hypothetical protein CcCBS67573_g03072 [Chytriomyces confervae]|uniref:tRNA-splicing endonuclease subunit Sen34 n=1 Tax=Chytriomyces confervae TaxID=246404 RepID=A0A507FGY4_9FUNG|nr:hypothetical protein CcCBS67573_g03072 [Chytriomyces confervae]
MAPIRVTVSWNNNNPIFLVFNAEDSIALRTNVRIVGTYSGTLPSHPTQNKHLAMPLVLSLEQVLVAALKGAVYLADDTQHHAPQKFSESEQHLETYVQERVQFFEERRLAGIEAKAMLKERHTKGDGGGGCVDEESVKPDIPTQVQDQTEVDKNPTRKLKQTAHSKMPLSKKKQIKDASAHIFSHQKPVVATLTESTELAWFNPLSSCASNEGNHATPGTALVARFLAGQPLTHEQCAFEKFKVFENLWERGYFLTSAVKFGGDFLLYPGDPLLHHASHVVVVVPMESKLTPFDIISYARMGRNAKKRILLMQYQPVTRTVSEMDLNWTGWK